MDASLLIEVISSLDQYNQATQGSKSLEGYRNWLNDLAYKKEMPANLTQKYNLDVYDLENEIAKQVILLGRYTKSLLKKSMENYPVLSNEDFTYLFRLMDYDSLTKTELIEKNAHEKQTGSEIIKRLVKNGLISENPDPEDKRSVRVSVTEKGKETFYKAMKDITVISKIMCGKLSDSEKESLLDSLKKLNTFHHNIYLNYKEENIFKIKELV